MTEEKILTRRDVLKLIKERNNTAKGLDLSGAVFEAAIDLRKLNLSGIILKGANLSGPYPPGVVDWKAFASRQGVWGTNSPDLYSARLEEANLFEAHLEGADLAFVHLEGALLASANLKGACLDFAHLEGADLSDAHFEEAELWCANLQEARLYETHLEKANLSEANLKEAKLFYTHLEGARLSDAHLEGADLSDAHLEGAYLHGARFSLDTRLEDVDWGNYILAEEKDSEHPHFDMAEKVYRRLKQWYTNAGMYDIAGKFFFRERTARRKALKWRPNPLPRIRQTLYWLLCGYGERPWQVFASATVVLFCLARVYFAIGTLTPNTFLNSLYYSAVSFTALGYGSWAPQPTGWVKGLGAVEAFVGVFMMALFLVTFIRKMTR